MELLKDLYRISTPSRQENKMIQFIKTFLNTNHIPFSIDALGNMYVTKGNSDTYPCLVSHLDEVHNPRGKGYKIICHRKEVLFGYNIKTNTFEGIGADDKNGIWICLTMLQEAESLKCVFFAMEEIGCIGSYNSNLRFFDDCRYVIECDRKGSSDIISRINGLELCSEKFLSSLNGEHFGYKATTDLQTDVFVLKERGLSISCVNLSCGYYEPHREHERTRFSELTNCLNFVRSIVQNLKEVYPHTPKFRKKETSPLGLYRNLRFRYKNL